MGFKAFIFDFDNTVIYSNEDHVKSFVETLKRHGFDADPDQIRRRFGMSSVEILHDLLPGLSKKEVAKIREEKERLYRSTVSKKGVRTVGGIRSLLEYLRKRKVKVAIVSSASVRNIAFGLRVIGLSRYFGVKVGAEDVKRHKPDPESLLKAMRKMKVKPKDCVFIGDSIYDVMAARRAGVRGLGMATGFYSKRQLVAKGAKMAFRNHDEVLRTLRSGRI